MSIITWRATELLNRTGRSGQGGGGGGGADARKTKPSGRCCSGNLQHKGAHTGQRGGARGGSAWAVSGGRLTDQINYTIKECRHEMKMSVPVRKFNQEIGFLLSVPPRVGVRAKGSAAGLWQAHQLRSVSAASSSCADVDAVGAMRRSQVSVCRRRWCQCEGWELNPAPRWLLLGLRNPVPAFGVERRRGAAGLHAGPAAYECTRRGSRSSPLRAGGQAGVRSGELLLLLAGRPPRAGRLALRQPRSRSARS